MMDLVDFIEEKRTGSTKINFITNFVSNLSICKDFLVTKVRHLKAALLCEMFKFLKWTDSVQLLYKIITKSFEKRQR